MYDEPSNVVLCYSIPIAFVKDCPKTPRQISGCDDLTPIPTTSLAGPVNNSVMFEFYYDTTQVAINYMPFGIKLGINCAVTVGRGLADFSRRAAPD